MSGRMTAEQTPDIAAAIIEALRHAFDGLCSNCLKPAATQADWINYSEGEGEHLCWEPGAECMYATRDPEPLRAQALAPVLAAAVREARVAELREAADDLTQLAVMEFDARPNAPRGAAIWDSAQWLKDRADRIAVDAPEGGEGR